MGVGRKRKIGKRSKCGQFVKLPPKFDHGTPEQQARKLAMFGSATAVGETNCPIERLRRQLTDEQYWAGQKCRLIYATYSAAIGAPFIVSGQLADFIQGGGGSAMSDDATERAVENYIGLIEAIKRYSRRALIEVQRTMHGSSPRDLSVLQGGLSAAADHLGYQPVRAVA